MQLKLIFIINVCYFLYILKLVTVNDIVKYNFVEFD